MYRPFHPLLMPGIILVLILLLIPIISNASWNIILNERFEMNAATWPWGNWHLGCYS
jgi:hypothetical protein